jgi:hypothetical protein
MSKMSKFGLTLFSWGLVVMLLVGKDGTLGQMIIPLLISMLGAVGFVLN